MLALGVVPWARDPANAVLVVEFLSFLGLLGSEKLHCTKLVWLNHAEGRKLTSVIIDEDVGTSSLQLVRRDCLLQRSNRGLDDSMQALLVDGHLNCHVWERLAEGITVEFPRCSAGIVSAVRFHVASGPTDLGNVTNQSLEEELAKSAAELQSAHDWLTNESQTWAGRQITKSSRSQCLGA